MPQTIAVNEGTDHRDIFGELSTTYEIDIQKSGTESHNSLGIGERYYDPLRNSFLKLREDHPNLKRDVLLAISTKAANDTLGPDGIVLSALVLGEFPSIRGLIGPKVHRATLADRAIAALEARKLMSKHLAQVKVRRAERHHTPRATEYVHQSGDQVLVWVEKPINSRIGIYRGSFTVLSCDADSKIVFIEEETGKAPKRYSTAQVKPYADNSEEVAVNFMSSLSKVYCTLVRRR